MTLPFTSAERGCLFLPDEEKSIVFQYNPTKVSRKLSPKISKQKAPVNGTDGGGDARTFEGSPEETIDLTLNVHATDSMFGGETAVENGLLPLFAALEYLVMPTTTAVSSTQDKADSGTITVQSLAVPNLVLQLNQRKWPVSLTSLGITETAFDRNMLPIEAEISLNFKVLTYDDSASGTNIYTTYASLHENRESWRNTALT